ncbi:MAG: hypothetical protein U1E98_05110 [Moraxella osloensis]
MLINSTQFRHQIAYLSQQTVMLLPMSITDNLHCQTQPPVMTNYGKFLRKRE